MEFRKIYAKQFLDIFKKNNIPEYLIADYEQNHFMEMKEWELQTDTCEKEIEELSKEIEQYKYEIEETLKSKAFRWGRKLTKKVERLDLSKFDLN